MLTSPDNPINELKKILARTPAFSERGAERFLEWWWRRKKEEKIFFKNNWEEFFNLTYCKNCFYFSRNDLCVFCSNPKRKKDVICVVVSPFAVDLIEREVDYNGLYFVLEKEAGETRNLDSINGLKRRVAFLKEKITREKINEIIIATDFTSRGEATALFIKENLNYPSLKISRLARGFHLGDAISYSDPVTLKKAFEKRENMN